ncbi:LysR family transcriptional regulator [Marinomonas colpomeniae]|uniref:LysR family transcriptional regulator n=1 Tax=Marinomonas colpomeniae TaxID=2774408 RepID=A0ABR8NUA0_9GAMM|nr:LysR family transcriptional regulator [Marinomonas colpomeniae]MBD5769626.1 LysR family transcriptional regulator [Marinomonas colpomeniae]
MDYNLLKALTALVSTSNVTRAAEKLHLSQPAASNALARLRTAMEDPILIRSGNAMIPTERAIHAAKEAELLIDKIEQLFSPPTAFIPETSNHRFVIALTDYGMQTVVPTLLQSLAKAAPNIELDIRLLGDKDSLASLSEALLNNEVDFLISRMIETPKAFNSIDLFQDQFVTIASSHHSRINKELSERLFLKEKHILVSFSGDRHGLVDAALKSQSKNRVIAHTVSNFYNAALMVEKTDLLCTVSEKVVGDLSEKFNIQTLPCPIVMPKFSVGMYWSRVQDKKPEHVWFIQFLKSIQTLL